MDAFRTLMLASTSSLVLSIGCAGYDDEGIDEVAAQGNGPAGEIEVASTTQAIVEHKGFLPHNEPRRFTAPNGCELIMQHGNLWGAAYAKADFLTPGCYGVVELSAVRDGAFLTAKTPQVLAEHGFMQAQINWASIVGSDVFIANSCCGAHRLRFAGL